MANKSSVAQVAQIVKSEPARRFIVVSAPGKTDGGRKVTDVLIDCYREIAQTGSCEWTFSEVTERFRELYCCMSEAEFENLMAETKSQMELHKNYDFCVSRGEYLSAYFFAKRIGFPFLDATELICFNRYEGYSREQTEKQCRARLKEVECAVIPGFYGGDKTGTVATFSRGGSDISGSIVAQAVKADLYENWTDVDGILNADPRIVKEARIISRMTYTELRELSYLGASVMHPDALFPLVKARIPLNVRNTFHPDVPGTLISSCVKDGSRNAVTGIAGKKDFRILFVHKLGLNSQKSVVRKVLSILEYHEVTFEHMPSSLDAVNFLIPDSSLSPELAEQIVDEIRTTIHPDDIRVLDNLAIVSIVGRNMFHSIGVAAKMFHALAERKINIRMLIQGCREINMIAGIEESKYEEAIRVLYHTFLSEF